MMNKPTFDSHMCFRTCPVAAMVICMTSQSASCEREHPASYRSLRRYSDRLWMRVCRVLIDAPLDLMTKMAEQPLHRPGGAITERTDRVPLNLLRDLHKHIDLALVGAAFSHAHKYAPHPSHPLATWRALAAALVL